ncbi:hypothetical protein Tco_1054788 [Tanacetum coccineum]|uniref:Uncharacterized protein n=1 Tax=Tanacetum coccineum TaxID=301880 RepID=A0ABQ5GXT2_9ASTR
MTAENKLYFQAEKEAIFLILTGIGDEIYSTVDACNTTKEISFKTKSNDIRSSRFQNCQSVSTSCEAAQPLGNLVIKGQDSLLGRGKTVGSPVCNNMGYSALTGKGFGHMQGNAGSQSGLKTTRITSEKYDDVKTSVQVFHFKLSKRDCYMAKIQEVAPVAIQFYQAAIGTAIKGTANASLTQELKDAKLSFDASCGLWEATSSRDSLDCTSDQTEMSLRRHRP